VDPVKVRRALFLTWLGVLLIGASALAGPPYTTDDPEPVEYRHWELYLASQAVHDREGWTATLPHFEVNYGVLPNVQLHLIAPLVYSTPSARAAHYGYGDTELGIKYRFVQEGEWMPQIGTFPFLEIPTGSHAHDLGNGSAQLFVPLWLQKSFGPWTTYGGAGFWIDLGRAERQWWYVGWQAQRRLANELTLGAEVFYLTPAKPGDEGDVRFNLGAVVDLSDVHHVLLSAGRGFTGPNLFQGYIAYLATLDPHVANR
jgi:hypothetical protein